MNPPDPPDPLEVTDLLARCSVEDLNARAESYFARIENPDQLLAKPFGSLAEMPLLLVQLGQLVHGLELRPGQVLLDLGVGTGWTSRIFAQLGLDVIGLDVSRSALGLAQRASDAHPLFGPRRPPRWMVFDGHRIELPDASVDRVVCFDAFHHIPNWREVLGELARVLRPGGRAGFSEPGPAHSRSAQSQYEMRNFGVIENDIVMADIWGEASRRGFDDLRVAVYQPVAEWATLAGFDRFVGSLGAKRTGATVPGPGADHGLEPGEDSVAERTVESMRAAMADRRMFVLSKAGDETVDSRRAEGLRASLEVTLVDAGPVAPGAHFAVQVRVANTGAATWLPAGGDPGAVWVGAHHHDAGGELIRLGHLRAGLPPEQPREIGPGEALEFVLNVPAPSAVGRHGYRFDLVAEQVGWFSVFGMATPMVWFDVA